ncbi:MAG TPA: FAD-binding protein [Solirubrobacteraceae bacterium]
MSVLTRSPEEICDVVRELPTGIRLLPVGGGTKPALSATMRGDVELLDVSGLRGIVEYDPAELTLTALSATPVSEIARTLAEHDQYLPFDPPLARAGATIGGVIATGVSGAGALRHGAVRDFVIGVRFVDGTGRIVGGGGRVVKNAAGFDFPKLMVGSIGRLGVITQASLKVFPRPQATTTVELMLSDTRSALDAASALARGPINLDALDVLPDGSLLARLGGSPELLAARADRVVGSIDAPYRVHTGDGERQLWRDAAEFGWLPPENALVRAGLSMSAARELDRAVAALEGVQVRYAVAGTTAWIACPIERLDAVDALLLALRLPGLVLRGVVDRQLLGPGDVGGAFAARVARALDPQRRFMELPRRIESTL